jgi:hypothetical protein
VEENIRACLEMMRQALNGKTPHFKEYWDARGKCLPLFKTSLSGSVRSQLWEEYTALSTEARHLKEKLDEEATFIIEQVDLAIQSLDEDLEKIEEKLAVAPEVDFPILEGKREFYAPLQKELNFLSMLATRVTTLRKEVIKTEMRIRTKNKLLERLSLCGDKIFPRRKELIGLISQEFLKDVMDFGASHNENDLRNDIRNFQQMARGLTLDTQTFNQTRLELSRLWDLAKEVDTARKQESAEKREVYQKNKVLVQEKINLFAERCQKEMTPEEAAKQSKDILMFMKTVELGREEIFALKEELAKARLPVDEKLAKKQEEREREIEANQKQKQEKIDQFRQQIQEVSAKVDEMSLEELNMARQQFQQKLQQLIITHAQKELLEQELKVFRDLIIDKREKAISTLTSEQKQSLSHLHQVLKDRKEQENEVRNQLKVYRKDLAGSGFDFEKAMRLKELMDVEMARLDKVKGAIVEIEKQIDALEGA